jgi:hypothetical protein
MYVFQTEFGKFSPLGRFLTMGDCFLDLLSRKVVVASIMYLCKVK